MITQRTTLLTAYTAYDWGPFARITALSEWTYTDSEWDQ